MLRKIEWTALALFHAWFAYVIYSLVSAGGPSSLLWLALALPLSVFLADLFTGLIHWACDSIGNSETPIWGPAFVKPFRDHHREPARITLISIAENLGASAMGGLLVLGLSSSFLLSTETPLFLSWLWLLFVGFAVWSNLFHRWSHIPLAKRPSWLKAAQISGIVLHPRTHSLHHRNPFRVNYCILNGWANPITNRVPWVRLEFVLKRFGIPIDFD